MRLRPVLMTALAMVIGMLPMALGLGEGGEQNAPLGRAVIGGLLFATVSTLFFVPVVFSIIHRNYRPKAATAPASGGSPCPSLTQRPVPSSRAVAPDAASCSDRGRGAHRGLRPGVAGGSRTRACAN